MGWGEGGRPRGRGPGRPAESGAGVGSATAPGLGAGGGYRLETHGATPEVTEAEIVAGLSELGLAGRTLMVHSSLRAFGHVRGGAEAVLGALRSVVGTSGVLVLPSFAWCADEAASGEGWPPGGRLAAAVPPGRAFDPAQTPAETGRISDTFWRQPGVLRAAHPTHALAATGPAAGRLLEPHPADRCCAWDGPYGRLAAEDAWVVLLGVGVSSLTFLHAIEDRCGAPYLGRALGYLRRGDGVWGIPQVAYPSGDRDFYHRASRVADWIAAWPGDERRVARIGGATVTALSTRALARRGTDRLTRDPLFLLCRRPGCAFCAGWRRGQGEGVGQGREDGGEPPR